MEHFPLLCCIKFNYLWILNFFFLFAVWSWFFYSITLSWCTYVAQGVRIESRPHKNKTFVIGNSFSPIWCIRFHEWFNGWPLRIVCFCLFRFETSYGTEKEQLNHVDYTVKHILPKTLKWKLLLQVITNNENEKYNSFLPVNCMSCWKVFGSVLLVFLSIS